MIDCHCHLEQSDYNLDRKEVIEKCKKELNAVVTSCAHPNDFKLTMQLVEKYKGFVYATVGIHPEYIKEIKTSDVDEYLDLIKKNKDKIVGLGENGLDYWWIRESEWQEKQRKLFIKLIEFAKELKKPLVVHCRDAYSDCVNILEQQEARDVHLHMWDNYHFVKNIIDNGWYVSVGPIVTQSKRHKRIVRDVPIEKLLLETDSPWFGGKDSVGNQLRGEPTNIKIPAAEIAKIKKIELGDVLKICGNNAVRLFSLPIRM